MIPMAVDDVKKSGEELLTLGSRVSDLTLIPPWIERLGGEHAIPGSVQFAMNLCLEEVLSNVIRHGYLNQPNHPILVRYAVAPDGSSLLVVEDEAPMFNPLAAEETPVGEVLEGNRVGGMGIRLVRGFASGIEYEPTSAGNRLTMAFSARS